MMWSSEPLTRKWSSPPPSRPGWQQDCLQCNPSKFHQTQCFAQVVSWSSSGCLMALSLSKAVLHPVRHLAAQPKGPDGSSIPDQVDMQVAGCVYVEHRPQTLQLDLQQLGHEAALGFDPVSLRGLASHAEWGCYPTVSEVDQLLSYLNPRGKK